MSFAVDELTSFLIDAKIATYASMGDDASVQPLLKGSRQLQYADGGFLYRDLYFGSMRFMGQETVYHEDSPVWGMVYCGGVGGGCSRETADRIYTFLRECLGKVPREAPFRGSSGHSRGEYAYVNRYDGFIDRFSGYETINADGSVVYALRYSGGFIL